MPTDTERREVARRLRAYLDTPAPWHLADVLFDVLRDDGDFDKIQHLADLIEPSCDRDALLRLARYMDKDVAETEAHFSNVISTKSVSDYARRIRKALGGGVMSETVPIKEHNHLFDLYDADGCLVGKASPGKKVMLADAFYVPERTCRNLNPPSCRDFECSECGESSEFTPGFMPNYCPNCGARVVEEASDDADR